MKKIKVFTAFSGYDSQCMALDRLCCEHRDLEYELVGWSEIEPHAIASHNVAFPEYAHRNYGDISKVDWNAVDSFELFTYSSPCTSFSMAGLREGGEEGSGTASSLLWECRRAIEIKRPTICVFENVKALVDKTMDETFEKWELTMCRLGYKNDWRVINAADYGVPQHRERIIMVSVLASEVEKDFAFPASVALTKKAEDILEDADDSFYLPKHYVEEFLRMLGDEKAEFHSCYNVDVPAKCIARIVTPTCKGRLIPTLTAAGTSTRPKNMLSTKNRPCPGVIEIWGPHESFVERFNADDSRDKFFNRLYEGEFVRLRNLSARERLRAMGVDDKYITRLTVPRLELSKLGYTENDINALITVDGKLIKNTDRSVGKQAGNSIIVDILYRIFKKLLIDDCVARSTNTSVIPM